MTIGNEPIRARYVGNGSTRLWSFGFSSTADRDVAVYVKIGTNAQIKLNSSQFTLNRTATGGTVTYPISGDELTSNDIISIIRETPFENDFNFRDQERISPSEIEDSDDDKTRQIQQLNERINRAVTVQETDDTDPQQLIEVLLQAEKNAIAGANTATTQAGIATAQAGTAATQASISTTQAGIATAQAGNAAQSAVDADVAKIEWRGAWSSATAYEARDAVSNSGSSWIAKRANTNVTPVVGDDWDQLAQKGTDGTGTFDSFTAGTGLSGSDGSTVENGDTISLDFATQAEAEAGTNTTKAMNPQRVAQAIEASATGGVPVGSIHAFVTLASVPSDYLVLNGSSFSSVTYPDLFAVLGSTTLPDMRGEFPRAADLGRGVDAGRAVGSSQGDAYREHSHRVGVYARDTEFGRHVTTLNGVTYTEPSSNRVASISGGNYSNRKYGGTSIEGSSETRPRNIAWVYAIKAE